ncbi:L-histidine N(alpha)-methyltransferase [Flavihumibacter sp. R14]|nr:L-histidine N(alpha)-methyltransferase [Flavihumibacter soli]
MNSETTFISRHSDKETLVRAKFLQDVLKGLSSSPKYLESKYFYDNNGDRIFQQIMRCPEYYPTDCELEILSGQTAEILHLIRERQETFDLVELGAGDALKSSYLLKYLIGQGVSFTYYPIDISSNVIESLTHRLPAEIPGLVVKGLNGEYFNMLEQAAMQSSNPKLVLFLGSNIGNMFPDDALKFCIRLRESLAPGDLLLVGFDLKKDPNTVLAAYNDKQGYTKEFNLNLLTRINRELDGDFDVSAFQHYPTYNPESGACESYLVSSRKQQVHIDGQMINFEATETIHMEISQKYTPAEADQLAKDAGFVPLESYVDSKGWFLDTIWQC